MKTFKQHIKESGYEGDAFGVGTPEVQSVEDGSIGVHNIHIPEVLKRVNAFVSSIADKEYMNPQAALEQLKSKISSLGLTTKDSIKLEGKNGNFEAAITQFGGRFGKDTDGSDINDDGISQKLGRELKLKGKYETLENGCCKVYAELV